MAEQTKKGRRLRAVSIQGETVTSDPFLSYDPKHMVCRGESHDMPYGTKDDHWAEDREGKKLLGWKRVLVCRRCKLIQIDRCDIHGNMSRSARYPKGYRISRAEHGFVGRRATRLARLRQQLGAADVG